MEPNVKIVQYESTFILGVAKAHISKLDLAMKASWLEPVNWVDYLRLAVDYIEYPRSCLLPLADLLQGGGKLAQVETPHQHCKEYSNNRAWCVSTSGDVGRAVGVVGLCAI